MKNKQFRLYYLLACIGVLIGSYYPLSMGVRVITDMIVDGMVLKENYPKYVIPYTPISIALIAGVLLMPLFIKLFRKYAFAGVASLATGVFFALELLFERRVLVLSTDITAKLEDWQMYLCAVNPFRTQTPLDILTGAYSPAFKLHFYMISMVLILTILNVLYGFGQMVLTGNRKRMKSLTLQGACSLAFLGLCILACFTAFWRDGNIQVSPLSAVLMSVFFVLLGVTTGLFVGSFLLGMGTYLSVCIPAMTASIMTLLMYIGEMILLNGRLYCFGTGFLFRGIHWIVLAPIDLFIIAASGCITAAILSMLNRNTSAP